MADVFHVNPLNPIVDLRGVKGLKCHIVSCKVLVCVFRANVNCLEEKNHWTPLHLAVQNNHPQVVR